MPEQVWISIADGAEQQSAWQDVLDLNAVAKLLYEAGEPLLGEYYATHAIELWLAAPLRGSELLERPRDIVRGS